MLNKVNIDLLSDPRIISNWVPKFISNLFKWKAVSGKWEINQKKNLVCHGKSNISTGENILINGKSRWKNYNIEIQFEILSSSIKPPEGGVILYYRYRSFRNYYSLHFCHAKNKIELIKRVDGKWETIHEHSFSLETNKKYNITLRVFDDFHECLIDGKNAFKVYDNDVLNGYIGIGTKYCSCEFFSILICPEKLKES